MKQTHLNTSACCDNTVICCPPKAVPNALGPSIWSSVLMALGGMGDALLYAYLPIKGEVLGMTVFSISLLLSINKFARFFTNRWIAYLSSSWGIKNVLLLGVVLSSITTLTYALNPAIWLWVVARFIWGAAYSALRFSTIQYAGKSTKPGSALGIGRSIQEIGPLLAYWLGPVMLSSVGAGFTFTAWALLLLVLLPIFQLLPNLYSAKQDIKPFSFQKPEWIDVWVFVSSFAVEGLLIIGVSKLLSLDTVDADHLIWVAALYISARRFLNVIISPLFGRLSDTLGFGKVFQISCAFIVAGLVIIAFGMEEAGILMTFIGSAVNLTLVPIIAIDLSPAHQSLDALTRMSTSRDLGSAVGSSTGLSLLIAFDHGIIFAILAAIIISVWFKIRKLDYNHE